MTEQTLAKAQALIERGERLEARSLLASALSASPDNIDALHLLATIDMDDGEFAAARQKVEAVLRADPSNAAATYNLGVCLMREELLDEALAKFVETLRQDPKHSGAMYNIGWILRERGQLDDARRQFEQLVRHNVRWASAWEALIETNIVRGRAEEALTAAEETVRLGISTARIQRLRGNVLADLGRLSEAEKIFKAEIASNPNDAAVLQGLGSVYLVQGRIAESIPLFERVILISAADKTFADRFDPALSELLSACRQIQDWRRLAVYEDQARVRVGSENGRISTNVLQRFVDIPQSLQATAQRAWPTYTPKAAGPATVAPSPNKLRIGWLTDHLVDNAATHHLASLLEQRDRSVFEIIGYSIGLNTASDTRYAVRNAFDLYRGVAEFSEERIAEFIRADNLDLLVCSLHQGEYWRPGVLLRRPAPVIVSYAGQPGTLGNAAIDYVIADATLLPPQAEAFFDEKVVWLPGSYRPVLPMDRSSKETPTRKDFGLTDGAIVFCNFSPTIDSGPEVFKTWMQILKDVPGSELWLGEPRHSIRAIIRSHAADCGVDADRLVFSALTTRDLRLAQTELADLCLDTWPNQDFDAVHDALAAGVPVVSLSGNSFHSRIGKSLLDAAGLGTLVTESVDAYRARAVELAKAPARLSELRRSLAEAPSSKNLFDVKAYNTLLLDTFRQLIERNRQGAAPSKLDVAGKS